MDATIEQVAKIPEILQRAGRSQEQIAQFQVFIQNNLPISQEIMAVMVIYEAAGKFDNH